MTKEKIVEELHKGFDKVAATGQNINDSAFFGKHDLKWSAANNIEHLILSVKPLTLAFRLPKFVLLFFGKPNRPILTYDELVSKYLAKLSSGGRASAAFVPRSKRIDKNALINSFIAENKKFVSLVSKWNEADLDRYLLPHPLLGKLYAREMLYFTIHHTKHHLRAIEKLI